VFLVKSNRPRRSRTALVRSHDARGDQPPGDHQLADLLFTPSEDGDENLRREGIPAEKIFRVGNVMIDSLVRLLRSAQKVKVRGLPERYVLVTLHRPANVDDSATLKRILESLLEINRYPAVVFPAHPRTRQRIADFGLNAGQLRVLDPLPYVDFLGLQSRATVVITDSGGIQEETTYLGVPCLTVRENTERLITVSMGTNVLVGRDRESYEWNCRVCLAGMRRRELYRRFGTDTQGSASPIFWLGDRHSESFGLNRYRNPWACR